MELISMDRKIKKVLAVTGIKSEYDILFPVLEDLKRNSFDVCVAVSGAHLSEYHNKTFERIVEDGFTIVDKIDTLLSTDRVVQRSKGTGLLIQGLTQTVERLSPDVIMMVGDREESIAAAIVGNYMDKLVLHIGGGDPVFGNADDPVRFAVSKLAHIHCCTAKEYAKNLMNIGEEEFRIFFTGNPAYANIDSVMYQDRQALKSELGISSDNYIVLIQHPLSSEYNEAGGQIETTLLALKRFCEVNNYQTVFIPPNSDPGSGEMRSIINKFKNEAWLLIQNTLSRTPFINLIRHARVLVGNSSMGILEAPHYKLPVVNVGKRQMGRLNAGNVEFVSHTVEEIVKSVEKAALDNIYREKVKKLKCPFGDGTAPSKIRNVIESIDLNDRKWYIKKKLC